MVLAQSTGEGISLNGALPPGLMTPSDLNALSWNDIFELRKSAYIPQYRGFLSGFHLDPTRTLPLLMGSTNRCGM